jgi:prepilin signal peptidase PulO-like enzyme (type II secretory pathway)
VSAGCVVAMVAVAAAAIGDALTGYIFDRVVALGLIATIAASVPEHRIAESTLGAGVGFGVMLAIRLASSGEGLGLGDVKLASLIGAGLGPAQGLVAIGAAFIIGAAAALGFLAAGRLRRRSQVRFGPYLLAGSLCDLAYHRLGAGVFS